MSERERALVLHSPTQTEKVAILSHDVAANYRLGNQTYKDLLLFAQINYRVCQLDKAFKKPNTSKVTVIIEPLEDDEDQKRIQIKRSEYEPTREKLTHRAFEIYVGFLRQNKNTIDAASAVLGYINDMFLDTA